VEQNLTQAEIVKMAAKAGAQAAIERLEKEKADETQRQWDIRFENISLLLKHYRELKAHCENSVYEASQLDEDAIDILNFMYDPRNKSDEVIESIKGSALKTMIIMCHIDSALSWYKGYCRKLRNPDSIRACDVVYDTFVSDDMLTRAEIINKYNISDSTYYRDIKEVRNALAFNIFGANRLLNSKIAETVEP